VNNYLEKPVCGDDQREYLLEELGEVNNSRLYDGGYGCAISRTHCVVRGGVDRIVSEEEYLDTREPDETVGRLKQDSEICYYDTSFARQGIWMDQDYAQQMCRSNTLYGSVGVRWFNQDYIKNYPEAVKGGVDDDWNQFLSGKVSGLTSDPDKDSYSFSSESPVPTGTKDTDVATLGFCGGDDRGEFLVTQQCNARQCQTDTSVIGVAKVPGSCILDGSQYPQVSHNERRLYEPGDSVTFSFGASNREIACFDGTWYGNWPVVFEQDKMEVGKGETRRISFKVINVEENAQRYRVELVDTEVAQFAEFASKDGSSFTTRVPAQSSKTFQVEVYGGDTSIGSSSSYADLRLQAEAVDAEISGEDRAGINIVKNPQTGKGKTDTGPKNVPGIGLLQLLVIALLSTFFVFSQS
ncbi:MAG: hypothetical protein ABEJ07_06065, partial [Candidatus Nanohaloarchaea archaeon]